ncbi:MAG: MarR family transcriptional regulator [Dehalococcoidia bacterium]|nr:MarR family transcriptional regulator [Dehalococcoidia bacterium]
MSTPDQQEGPNLDAAIQAFSEALAIFDPLRFRAWAELGLTTAQLRVLFLLRESPGVTAGELASRLSVTPPTISGIVDRLVKLGLVQREDDPNDRRLVRNHLTGEGEQRCSRLEEGGDRFTRRILVEMTDAELDALLRGLRAFVRANEHVQCKEPNLAEIVMPGTQ